jgi:predicted alpha/beta-fold hydrolase
MQTVAAILGKAPPYPKCTVHHHVLLPDGDQLLLSVDHPPNEDIRKPIILLMHGLGGSGLSKYMLRHSHHLTNAGFIVVRFHHRGCGPVHLDKARDIYHSGRTGDIDAALHFIGRRWPDRRCAAVGYSMSGNMLLRYLGRGTHAGQGIKEGKLPPSHLCRALAICPPIDLERCSQVLATRENWYIHNYLIRHVMDQARTLEERNNSDLRTNLPHTIDLRIFDRIFTAPRAGFQSREEYYARCSSKDALALIKIPTTILSSIDDPIVPSSIFKNVNLSSSITLQIESAGGHMGFISDEKTELGDRRWMDFHVFRWATNIT